MPLNEEVSLDISEALRQVDTLEAAFAGAAQSFQTALVEAVDVLSAVTVSDVDASAVTESIDEAVLASDAAVEVQAITDDITAEIDAAIADADASVEPITVPVEVDAGPAQQEIQELGNTRPAIDRLGSAIGGLGAGLGGVAREGGIAGEQLAALASKVGPIGGLTAGVLALGGGLVALGLQGAEVIENQERFNRVLGDSAGIVENLHLDGLGDDLSEIAIKVGADDEAFRSFAARVVETGVAAGSTREESAQLAATVIKLATALSLNNKELGSASEVAPRLFAALQRGGRALSEFGLSIPQSQLKQLAGDLSGAETPASQFTKALAGAAIAEGQVADKGIDLAGRANDLTTSFASLKTQIGETFEDLAVQAAPGVEKLLGLLVPVVGAAANVADGIGDVARGFVQLATSDNPSDSLESFGDALRSNEEELERSMDGVVGLGEAGKQFAKDNGIAFDEAGRVVGDYGGALDKAADHTNDFEEATAEANEELQKLLDAQQAYINSILGLDAANDRFSDSLKDNQEKLAELNEAIRTHGRDSQEAKDAQEAYSDALNDSRDAAVRQAEAELNRAEALAEAEGRVLSSEQKQNIFRGTLEKLAAQADGPTKTAITNLLKEMDKAAINREINLAVHVLGIEDANANLNTLNEQLRLFKNQVPKGVDPGLFFLPLGAAMAGGAFEGGETGFALDVGERGRERIFIEPHARATVIPGQKLHEFTAGGPVGDSSALVAAINRLAAQSGRSVSIGELHAHEVSSDPATTAFSVATILGDLVAR